MQSPSTPTVRQSSVFVENRVGQLMRMTQLFDQADIRIVAVSVVHSVDCAILRMILDNPDKGYEVLSQNRFPVSETELLVVSLPPGKRALLHTWAALLEGEVNIYYTYPLIIHPHGSPAMAVCLDNIAHGAEVLRKHRFDLIDEASLREERG